MALSAQLEAAGVRATRLKTTATVTLEKDNSGFVISAVHLDLVASIPESNREVFDKATAAAKSGCPVSRVLNAKITLDAKLE